jgi:hypothetical protein
MQVLCDLGNRNDTVKEEWKGCMRNLSHDIGSRMSQLFLNDEQVEVVLNTIHDEIAFLAEVLLHS